MATSKQPRVWVLIADGEHARVVTPQESHGHFETVIAFDSASAHLRSADLGTDKPGRTFESASITRHAIAAALPARRIVLQSTAQGLSLYQRMGFDSVTRILVYNSL